MSIFEMMLKWAKAVLAVSVVALGATFLTACDTDDDGLEEVGDELEDATDELD